MLRWPWNLLVAAVALASGVLALVVAGTRLRALAASEFAESVQVIVDGGAPAAAALKDGAALDDLVRLPRSIADVKQMQEAAQVLIDHHFFEVLLAFTVAYLFKQAFSVPGAAALNVLSGALWGLPMGWPLSCVLTACGASLSFLLSRACAAEMAAKAGPEAQGRFAKALFKLRAKVREVHREEGAVALTLYLASLRMVPVTPQWLLNIVLPHAEVPLPLFFASILLGLLPYNFVTVSAGSMISSVETTGDLMSFSMLLRLGMGAAVLAALPLLSRKLTSASSTTSTDNNHSKTD
ncbi:Transmembrane protein 41A-A [Hondaea fermentalgiana]|uniref:Transmembrane protein 41A-A n=1 Tax=Hondaea fermentalgiana TaxID=2315210 RepID=A0A2R5GDH2_9STRA|nr:Transmembrane protein 41A-A [Hondaea fermentalgiana]|eukprot:GBG26683.1 Transmembrane protein 41A-A [Hondaea fermentalgiana]